MGKARNGKGGNGKGGKGSDTPVVDTTPATATLTPVVRKQPLPTDGMVDAAPAAHQLAMLALCRQAAKAELPAPTAKGSIDKAYDTIGSAPLSQPELRVLALLSLHGGKWVGKATMWARTQCGTSVIGAHKPNAGVQGGRMARMGWVLIGPAPADVVGKGRVAYTLTADGKAKLATVDKATLAAAKAAVSKAV